jgi:hypothetical protein
MRDYNVNLINYGPNYDLVAEVVSFAQERPLLQPRPEGERAGVPVLDIAEAKRLASDETWGPDEMTWRDIHAREVSVIYGAAHGLDWYNQPGHEFSGTLKIFTEIVKARVSPDYEELYDYIIGDLYCVAGARAVLPERHPFFEQTFEIYKAGGWPCGWSGILQFPPSDHPWPDDWWKTCQHGPLMAFYPAV